MFGCKSFIVKRITRFYGLTRRVRLGRFTRRALAYFMALFFLLSISTFHSFAQFPEPGYRIRINIPEYRLELLWSEKLFRVYTIAVGKPTTPSPVGNFHIANKVTNPTWYPPDRKQPPVPPGPSNPLGKYWMGLNLKGYGIHGNSAPWSIGSSISLGCFRMHNPAIEELYHLVPIGTPVEVIYQTVHAEIDQNNQAWLEVFPDIYNRINQPEVIATSLAGLNWSYEIHQPSLQELLTGKKPLKIKIPRSIKIVGAEGVDGFYWEGEVYVSKKILGYLEVTQEVAALNSFTHYLDVKGLSGLKNPPGYLWDESMNTLYLSLVTASSQTLP